jgi:hypothetical protein
MQEARRGRVVIEGLVIVLSILLAFAIDAAWELRGERNREAELLQSLTQEYQTNRATLISTIDLVLRDRELGASFYLNLSTEELRELDQASLQDIWGALHWPRSFELASGATTAALSSGRLDLLRDPQLRELVAGWPARTADIRERTDVMVGFEQAWYDFVARHPALQQAATRVREGSREYLLANLQIVQHDDEALTRGLVRTQAAGLYINDMRQLVARADSTLALLQKR